MKKLLNIAVVLMFGSMSFVVLTSEKDSYEPEKGFEVGTYRKMMFEHPIKTIAGAGLLGADIIRQIRGKVPANIVEIAINGVSKQWMRQRNVGAFLLGYTFYKTYTDKDRKLKDYLYSEYQRKLSSK